MRASKIKAYISVGKNSRYQGRLQVIYECDIDVDFNGAVLFVYPRLMDLFGGAIEDGQNILEAFTSTNKGDEILDLGWAWPIMGIHDGSYRIRFFIDETLEATDRKVLFEDKHFYLDVCDDLYLADMAVFWEWETYTGWKKIPVPIGKYKGSIAGVHTCDENGETLYGFDIQLHTIAEAFNRTVEPRSDSRLV